jgi:hypothetical protein
MKKASLQPEILHYLDTLAAASQQKVLEYIKTLTKTPEKNNNPKPILQFAGAFTKKDLKEINSAIEQGCEQIDRNEW